MALYQISGHVSEGFERVRTLFEKNFIDGLEKCAQLCVYVGEEKVVDLWGSVTGSKEYDGDTVTNVFSSTKSLAAICMATLVDKNLMDYGDRIIQHWPEYGSGDEEKEKMTIADILRHEGGMANFSKTLRLADLLRENIKKNSIGSIIEKEPLCFPPPDKNTKTQYHTFTRGYILNEIFRRVDPEHRTIGECLRDEICKPLDADCYIGLEFEQLTKSYELSFPSPGQIFISSFIPKSLGRKSAVNAIDIMKVFAIMPKKGSVQPAEFLPTGDMVRIIKFFDISTVKMSELPSANGQCSARGLAKIAAMIVNGGTINGKVILSKDTCEKFHGNYEETKIMYPLGINANFSQGGVNYFFSNDSLPNERLREISQCRAGYIGWMGIGGSIFQWHPEHKIGFAYVPTYLAWEDLSNSRGAFLQKVVLDCVKDIQMDEKNVSID